MKLIVILLCVGLSASCASAGGTLVLTEDAIHDSLARVDDEVRRVCTGPAGSTLAVPCKEVRQALIPAMEAGAAFNLTVATQSPGQITDLLAAVGRVAEAIRKFPEGETVGWVQDLLRSLAAAYQVLTGGKQ